MTRRADDDMARKLIAAGWSVQPPQEKWTLVRPSRDWQHKTVVLIGGGPSLRGFNFERLRGEAVVVALNDAAFYVPWADACVSIDRIWLLRRRHLLEGFAGERIAVVPEDYRQGPVDTFYRRIVAPGLSADPGAVNTGGNTGFAALGLAIMRGASKIALLGYDMTEKGHWHGGYDWPAKFGASEYPRWAELFSTLATAAIERHVDVVNCNRESAIRCFRFGDVDDEVLT